MFPNVFSTQQVVLEAHGVVWQRLQGYQRRFHNWSGMVYCTKQAHKTHKNDFGKRPNKWILLLVLDHVVAWGYHGLGSASRVPIDKCARLTCDSHRWSKTHECRIDKEKPIRQGGASKAHEWPTKGFWNPQRSRNLHVRG